jgi:hypothetical protein
LKAFLRVEVVWESQHSKSGSQDLSECLARDEVPSISVLGAIPRLRAGPSSAGAPPGLLHHRRGRPRSPASGRYPAPAGSCRGSPISTPVWYGGSALPEAPGRRLGLFLPSLYRSVMWSRSPPKSRTGGHVVRVEAVRRERLLGGNTRPTVARGPEDERRRSARTFGKERLRKGYLPVSVTGYTVVSLHCSVSCSGIMEARW